MYVRSCVKCVEMNNVCTYACAYMQYITAITALRLHPGAIGKLGHPLDSRATAIVRAGKFPFSVHGGQSLTGIRTL